MDSDFFLTSFFASSHSLYLDGLMLQSVSQVRMIIVSGGISAGEQDDL